VGKNGLLADNRAPDVVRVIVLRQGSRRQRIAGGRIFIESTGENL
jgi:hypothetical protein